MTLDFDVESFGEAVAENDELHNESMLTFSRDTRELHAEARKAMGGTSRRDLLIRSVLASTALTFGSQVLPLSRFFTGVAGAQVMTDADIAAFAASLEYTAVAIYAAAAQTGKLTTPAVADSAKSFAAQHKAHGDAFAGLSTGKIAPDTPNKNVKTALSTQLSQAMVEIDVVKLLFQVENAAAATYQFALGTMESKSYQQLAASIQPIEAGHAAALGQIVFAGDPKKDIDKKWLPSFQTEAGFVDPAKNPVA